MPRKVVLSLSWKQALKVWWSFFWRSFLGMFLVGFIEGIFMSLFTVVTGAKIGDALHDGLIFVGTVVAVVPVGAWAVKSTFAKGKYSGFTLAIVTESEEQGAT